MGDVTTVGEAFHAVIKGEIARSREILRQGYPFAPCKPDKRRYTVEEKVQVFVRDGFIDRYTGDKLVNPGVLKVLSFYCPDEFPYHPHGKMAESHLAYWELFPTIDHVAPLARGGKDVPENRVTTSMLHNQVKNNWTLAQLNWDLHLPGKYGDWDGLTGAFIAFAAGNTELLQDRYISLWYKASRKALQERALL